MAGGHAVPRPIDLARALTPASVVIVGAKGSSATSYGVVEALNRIGFTGRIFAVNRTSAPAHGLPVFASCASIGEPVDAAVLLVPAAAVGDLLGDVAEAGIRTAAPDPDQARIEIEARLVQMKSVFPVAEAFGVEDLIDPRDTRPLLIRYLEAAIPRLAHDLGPKPRYGVRP